MTFRPALGRLDLGDLGLQHDGFVAFGDARVQRLHHVLVRAGHDLVHQLDHGDLRTECFIYRCHLEADDAAADDQHALRHILQRQCAGGVDDARIVVGEAGDARDAGAGGDDGVVEGDDLFAFGSLHCDAIGRGELCSAAHHLHFALLGEIRRGRQ